MLCPNGWDNSTEYVATQKESFSHPGEAPSSYVGRYDHEKEWEPDHWYRTGIIGGEPKKVGVAYIIYTGSMKHENPNNGKHHLPVIFPER